MKFLVVTLLSIYHGCSTPKTFWAEKLTGEKKEVFELVSMKSCGKRNVRKHREF